MTYRSAIRVLRALAGIENTDKYRKAIRKIGFSIEWNPSREELSDAAEALRRLADLNPDAIERVRNYIEAVADFPTAFAKSGVIARIPVIGKEPLDLNANDLQQLLRAVGVTHIGAGTIRIGHPTKGAGDKLAQQARDAGVPEDLIQQAKDMGRELHTTTPAEPGTEHPLKPSAADVRRDIAIERARIENEKALKSAAPGWSTNMDGSHNHGDLPFPGGEMWAKALEEQEREDWELLETTDCKVWAREFYNRYRSRWVDTTGKPIDLEALMQSWFASAIETGRAAGLKQGHEEAKAELEAKKLRNERKVQLRRKVGADIGMALDMILDLQDHVEELRPTEGTPTATVGDITITGPNMGSVSSAMSAVMQQGIQKNEENRG